VGAPPGPRDARRRVRRGGGRRPFLAAPLTLFAGFLATAFALALGVWLGRVAYLATGGVFAWAALRVSAHGTAFPFVLTLSGLGFIASAVRLARVDSPIRRWLAERTLPAPQRGLAY